MSNVLRSTTFQLEFNGNDGITGVKSFTKAVRDADAVVAELNAQLGENAKVTYKATSTKAELSRQARLIAENFQRQEKTVAKLTEQYQAMASNIGKTADEMEVLNALQRLGSNATEAQKQQVIAAVQNFQRLRDAQDGATGSMRDFRGVAQNAGWQLQDTVVQLQMGTNAFMVLSQQGSQFASAFGPTGAVIGAVIAVAGVIAMVGSSALGAASNVEKLEEATKSYEKYITVTKDGNIELSDSFEQIAHYSKVAADEMLKLSQMKALQAQAAAIQEIKAAIEDATPFGGNITDALGLRRNISDVVEFRAALNDLDKGVNDASLARFSEALALIDPKAKNAEKGTEDLKIKLYDLFLQLSKGNELINKTNAGWEKFVETKKKTKDAVSDATKAFESEFNALTKQTESVNEEYNRRKTIIDNYAKEVGKSNERVQKAYADLEKWKANELDKEFQTFYRNIIKQTNTTTQEYARRKAIIDDHVSRVGSVDTQAANAYVALEQWKTDEYSKEYDKREKVRREIEKAQIKTRRGEDPFGTENDVYSQNIIKLTEQRNSLAADQVAERERINKLLEGEMQRHGIVMNQLEMQSYQNQVGIMAMAAAQLTNIADLMASGANDVRERVKDMNDFQKALFITTQFIAAATALISGIEMGTKLAAIFPLMGPEMIALGTGLGAASAGAIMGTTIAGAFDKGGNIPTGQVGIVSEYGDELVNGVLVKGPARVTSREETARLMNGGGSAGSVNIKVSVQNEIAGAQYQVQQISADEVRVIATQVFNKNIDSGVSRVVNNRNSNASKALKQSFNITSKV